MGNQVTNQSHMIAVNGIHIFRNKSMGSLNCLKKRNLEGGTEDCVRQVETMWEYLSLFFTLDALIKLAQMSAC